MVALWKAGPTALLSAYEDMPARVAEGKDLETQLQASKQRVEALRVILAALRGPASDGTAAIRGLDASVAVAVAMRQLMLSILPPDGTKKTLRERAAAAWEVVESENKKNKTGVARWRSTTDTVPGAATAAAVTAAAAATTITMSPAEVGIFIRDANTDYSITAHPSKEVILAGMGKIHLASEAEREDAEVLVSLCRALSPAFCRWPQSA